jgi:hypothetical protein
VAQRNALPPGLDTGFWLAVALCVGGFVLVSVLDWYKSGKKPVFRLFFKDSGIYRAPDNNDNKNPRGA